MKEWNPWDKPEEVESVDAPPCPSCTYWKPVSNGAIEGGVTLCHYHDSPCHDFSCYEKRDPKGDLIDARATIDKIDEELLGLLCDRVELAVKIGALKTELGLPVEDPDRENKVITRAIEGCVNTGDLRPSRARKVFRCIIDVCRESQRLDNQDPS